MLIITIIIIIIIIIIIMVFLANLNKYWLVYATAVS